MMYPRTIRKEETLGEETQAPTAEQPGPSLVSGLGSESHSAWGRPRVLTEPP